MLMFAPAYCFLKDRGSSEMSLPRFAVPFRFSFPGCRLSRYSVSGVDKMKNPMVVGGVAMLLLLLWLSCQVITVAGANTGLVSAPGNTSPDGVGIAATWNSDNIGASFPDSIAPGESSGASVTFQNTGESSWTAARKIRMGAKNKVASMFGPKRVPTIGTITPGWGQAYTFTITAPVVSEGDYLLAYKMVRDGRRKVWFGDEYRTYITVTGSFNANLVADNLFSKTNTLRAGYALPGYARNPYLDGIAGTHSWAMAKSHKLSYDRAGDGTLENRLLGWSGAGESIAFIPTEGAVFLPGIADQAIDKWMNHDAKNDWRNRLNLLDGEPGDLKTDNMRGHPKHWDNVGVGAAEGKCRIGGKLVPGWFVTMDFFFVT